jgi:hypothetical protein
MLTCKDVSTLLSMGHAESTPLARRIGVWRHLAMCRHCRAFRRQLVVIGRMGRLICAGFEREPSPSFERKILDRLGS